MLIISKEFKILIKPIPSYYLATKYYCEFITEEVNYLSTYKHLLPKSVQRKVKVTDDKDDYLGLKNKVSKRCFAKIDSSVSKIYSLLLEKI